MGRHDLRDLEKVRGRGAAAAELLRMLRSQHGETFSQLDGVSDIKNIDVQQQHKQHKQHRAKKSKKKLNKSGGLSKNELSQTIDIGRRNSSASSSSFMYVSGSVPMGLGMGVVGASASAKGRPDLSSSVPRLPNRIPPIQAPSAQRTTTASTTTA